MGLLRGIGIVVLCTLGLTFAALGYRHQWTLSELPEDPALEELSYPVSIGDYRAGTSESLRFLAESWPPGTRLLILDADGEAVVVPTVRRLGTAGLILTGLGGTVFLAVAVGFFAPRLHRRGIGRFFWILFPYGLSIMLGGIFFPRDGSALVAFLGFLQLACLAALPVTFLRLALVFPQRAAILDRARWLIPLLGVAAAGLVAWQTLVFSRYFRGPDPVHEPALGPALGAADLFIVGLTTIGVAVFAVRIRKLELTRERDQVRWLLWGFAIGAAPYVFLRTLPDLFGLPALMPDHADRLIELAIPLAFIMAVVRHQFLDIDVIIRRSLLYGLLASALIGVYLVTGIFFGQWFGEVPGLAPWVLPIILGLGAGAGFRPLRAALGRWIDRTFFKLAHDHDRTLDRLDRALASAGDPAEAAAVLDEAVRGALVPEVMAVVLRDADDTRISGDLASGWGDYVLRAAGVGHGLVMAAPRSTSLPELEGDDIPLDLLEEGFVILQPLHGDDGIVGVILLGNRQTRRRYLDQDLAFLAAAGRVVGRHLHRIDLMRKVAAETLARRRLAELDRLKSDFLAQVAHDLRTPVSGIAWSARNLLDGLAGDLNDDQVRYLDSIRSSGAHLNRLVDNLLEISRMENARGRITLADFDAPVPWNDALGALAPQAAAKNVTLELEGAELGQPVRGDRDKMVEVTVNLLDNAVKYTGPGTTVTVTVQPPDEGFQAVEVRDRGPGLRGQDPARLFGRFAQGEPSPHSSRKGFGLGLHIAATYVDLMGGSLDAADHPDGGAVFTCRLPLAASLSSVPDQGDPS